MVPLHDSLEPTIRESLKAFDDLTAGLLARRGITTHEEAEAFLSPSYDEHIHDPMLMLNMPKAAARVAQAINSGERITVWSDYDCDGIPGGVVLHDFLKKAGANFTNYIPHRHLEGYGMNIDGIEKLAKEGTTLIITVDSGITDVEPVRRAQELGIDVIVTDHHLPQEELPPAFAVIDAKQEGETYPYKELCGGGVAWKLACAVLQHGFNGRENIPEGWEKWLLDMAGLSTIADMVPLTGENRVIAKYGLLVMRKSPRIGLQQLCKVARVNQRMITEDDVGFMLAPRVNAASRMGNPRDAFDLFVATDISEAERLAKELERINRARRATAGAITRSVHERLDSVRANTNGVLPEVIAMGDPEWRPGLLGLVANSIAEEFSRPVFLWGREGNGSLKGSCRAGRKGVHVLELMQATPETFHDFGGHAASGGFSVREDRVAVLEENLCTALASLADNANELEDIRADIALTIFEADKTTLRKLDRFAPFGMGNAKPMVVFRNVRIQAVSWFGKNAEHLKVAIREDGLGFGNDSIEAVTFYARGTLGDTCNKIEPGILVSLVGNLELDTFAKRQPVRVRIQSIHI